MIRFYIAIVASPYPLLDPHLKGRSPNNFLRDYDSKYRPGHSMSSIDTMVITQVVVDVPCCLNASDKDPACQFI